MLCRAAGFTGSDVSKERIAFFLKRQIDPTTWRHIPNCTGAKTLDCYQKGKVQCKSPDKTTADKHSTTATVRYIFAGYCNILQTGHTILSSTPDHQLENHSTKYHRKQPLYNTLELLMMGIVVPETCWASNKICNKNLCYVLTRFCWKFIPLQA